MPQSTADRSRMVMSVLLVVVLACLGGRLPAQQGKSAGGTSFELGQGSNPMVSAQGLETKSAARKTSSPLVPNFVDPRDGALLPQVPPGAYRLHEVATGWSAATEFGRFRERAPPVVS